MTGNQRGGYEEKYQQSAYTTFLARFFHSLQREICMNIPHLYRRTWRELAGGLGQPEEADLALAEVSWPFLHPTNHTGV